MSKSLPVETTPGAVRLFAQNFAAAVAFLLWNREEEGTMPLFLITSVCNQGVSDSSFRVVEAASPLDIAQAMLDEPYAWKSLLGNTELWWDLTYYEYKYSEPLDWSAEELLDKIDSTWIDGDSRNQIRIHEVGKIENIPPQPSKPVPQT